MIRVLHVVTYMGRGGLETMLMNYYRHIDRSKVQFDFLVHREFEADYDEEIKSLGGRIYHVSRLVPWSRRYKAELRRFFRTHPEYKIVHVHQDCLSSVALQCAKECGIPVRIAHSHNSNQDKNIKYLFKRYYMRKIPETATELFACGKAAGDWMFGGKTYRLLPNAIAAEKYIYEEEKAKKIKKELDLEKNLVIGHIGRFNPQKNHKFLIDIFEKCFEKNQKVRLMLIGDGEGRKEIENKVKERGLQDNVIFMGVRRDVPELLQAMDVFVFPSLYEGLPVTMIEEQAAGVPAVISDRVSEECIITKDLVKVEGLEETPEQWAGEILKQVKISKRDRSEEIKKAKYDVETNAKWLEEYYLRKAEVNPYGIINSIYTCIQQGKHFTTYISEPL